MKLLNQLIGPVLRTLQVVTLLTAGIFCGFSQAQSYPERPISLLVGFPPGGAFDSVMRTLAEELSKSLGQRVNIDNRAGAGGAVATQAVAAAPADGYTLLAAGLQLGTGPHLNKVNYNPLADLTMIGQVTSVPVMLLVRSDSSVKDAKDIVALAKKNTNGITVGSGGVGTTGHFGSLMLGNALGVSVVHVPFKGGAPGLQALVGGEIDMMFDQPSGVMQGLLSGGKIRAISVIQEQRSTSLPDVKSAPEIGLNMEKPLRGWHGIAVRTGTPPAVLQKLNVALTAAVNSVAFKAKVDQLGLDLITGSTPETFQKYYLAEYDRWGQFIKKHKITNE